MESAALEGHGGRTRQQKQRKDEDTGIRYFVEIYYLHTNSSLLLIS